MFTVELRWHRPLIWAAFLSLFAIFDASLILDGGEMQVKTTICVCVLWGVLALLIFVRPRATRVERVLAAVSPLATPIVAIIWNGATR